MHAKRLYAAMHVLRFFVLHGSHGLGSAGSTAAGSSS